MLVCGGLNAESLYDIPMTVQEGPDIVGLWNQVPKTKPYIWRLGLHSILALYLDPLGVALSDPAEQSLAVGAGPRFVEGGYINYIDIDTEVDIDIGVDVTVGL